MKLLNKFFNLLLLGLIGIACSTGSENREEGVITGLDGRRFLTPAFKQEIKVKLDSNLLITKKDFEEEPSEENYIWLGRRLAYLYRYDEAIRIFSQGIEKYPESYKLFRHRGHRYITIRDFKRAAADLQMAAALMPGIPLEIEPDGIPNKLNTPLSTTQFNVWYHLGLAHYLKGDFQSAERAYLQCLEVSNNDDLLCATADWLYMTYSRMGRSKEASKVLDLIKNDMKIIENDSYYARLKMYKGELKPDSILNVGSDNPDVDLAIATQGYGVGNWYLCNGDTTRAIEIFKRVTQGKQFTAFGFIAAEADLMRLKADSISN